MSVRAVLTADVGGLKRGMQEGRAELQSFRRESQAVQESAEGIALALAGVAAGVAVIGQQSTEAFLAMDRELKNLEAIGVLETQLDDARRAAEEFGPALGFFAHDAVKTLQEMSKAGIDFARLVDGGELGEALALLVSGELLPEEAAGYVANSLSIYKDEALSLKQIADTAVGAANASSTSVREMADANRQLGNVAAMVGHSFEEVNLQLALNAQAGLKGSDGATSVKTALLMLSAPTAEAKRIMEDLNLEFFKANGEMKTFQEIGAMLRDRLGEYNSQAKQMILSTIAGSDAIRFMGALMDMTADDYKKMNEEMTKTTSMEVAQTRMESFSGQLQQFRADLAMAGDHAAESFVPALRTLVEELSNAVEWFNGLSDGTRSALAVTATFVATAGAVNLALVMAARGAGAFLSQISGIVSATKTLTAANTAGAVAQAGANASAAAGAAATTGAAVGRLAGLAGMINPIIGILSLVAAGFIAYKTSAAQAAAAAEELRSKQEALNKTLSEDPLTRSAQTLEGMKKDYNDLAPLVREYEEAEKRLHDLQAKRENDRKTGNVSFATLSSEKKLLDEYAKEYVKAKQALRDFNVVPEEARATLNSMNDEIKKSTPAVRELMSAEIESIAAKRQLIADLKQQATEYDNLSAKESLNAEEKARLQAAVERLKQEIPTLNYAYDLNGKAIITNRELIKTQIATLEQVADSSADSAEAQIKNEIKNTEATTKSVEVRIGSLMKLIQAYETLAAIEVKGVDPTISDEKEYRRALANAERARSEIAKARADILRYQYELQGLQNDLARVNGNAYRNPTNNGGGGGKDYEPPEAPKKGGGSSSAPSEQPWEKAQRERNEAYEKALDKEAELFRKGLHNKAQYAAELSRIASVYYDVMRLDNDEWVRIREEISRNRADFALETVERDKQRMQERGESAVTIARLEVKAYQDALAKLNLLADDRIRIEQSLTQSLRNLKEAAFAASVDWIEREEDAMERRGASDVDVAKMVFDAWQRVYDRRGQGVYAIEDERRAADELADAMERLEDALANDLRRAREMNRDAAIKALEDERDALDERVEAEQYLVNLQKERTELAKLEADRAKVADDKRFELIRRDANGNLVREMVADLARIGDLDEQIREQRQRIVDMERDEELRRTREMYDKKIEAERAYWDALLDEERVSQDLLREITQRGLNQTLGEVDSYLDRMVASYREAQRKIIEAGGLVAPTSGGIAPQSSAWAESLRNEMNSGSSLTASFGARIQAIDSAYGIPTVPTHTFSVTNGGLTVSPIIQVPAGVKFDEKGFLERAKPELERIAVKAAESIVS